MTADSQDGRDHALTELRTTARRYLARALDSTPDEASGSDKPPWWAELAPLGWLGLVAPEKYGGAGAGLGAAAVIAEELAYCGAATPFMTSAVMATRALEQGGPSALAERWLPAMVDGTVTASVAVTGSNGLVHRDAVGPRLTRTSDDRLVIDGAAHYVADAAGADLLLVAAVDASGELVIAGIETAHRGVIIERLRTHDAGHRLSHVTVRQVELDPAAILAHGGAAEAMLAAMTQDGLFILAADSLGTARRAFDLALDYAKQRHQFNRPIGSFQAVKHKLADMYVLLTGSAALLHEAALALERGADNERSVVAVGSYVREAAARIAGDSMQIHGATGYTWEHPCHRLLKRAKFNERYLATLWAERDRLAGLALRPQG